MVRFVLRRGPFCPETWSVLSGPFCPWSVLSEYHIYGTAGQTQCAKSYKRDQRSHLGKTIDALIIGDNL